MRLAELSHASKMNVHSAVIFSSCILLCSVVTVFCGPNDGQCLSLVNGPFDICTNAGYNNTLPLPKELTEHLQNELAIFLSRVIAPWQNCSSLSLAAAMECSFFFPKCSKGKRVLPCKRVCGELMKQCQKQLGNDYREIYMDFVLAECLMLPDEKASSDTCFEPPKFTTNDSVPSKYFIFRYPLFYCDKISKQSCFVYWRRLNHKFTKWGRGG